MAKNIFKLKANYSYKAENVTNNLELFLFKENKWQKLDINTSTPGFLLFVYTIFTCQHTYLCANATERNILMQSSIGEIEVTASKEWLLEEIKVDFSIQLSSNKPNTSDIDYISSRMKECPVSVNISNKVSKIVNLSFK